MQANPSPSDSDHFGKQLKRTHYSVLPSIQHESRAFDMPIIQASTVGGRLKIQVFICRLQQYVRGDFGLMDYIKPFSIDLVLANTSISGDEPTMIYSLTDLNRITY